MEKEFSRLPAANAQLQDSNAQLQHPLTQVPCRASGRDQQATTCGAALCHLVLQLRVAVPQLSTGCG